MTDGTPLRPVASFERDARYRRALRAWLGKFDTSTRWPCHECGRPSPDDPPRANLVTQEDGKQVLHGCTMCNVDALIRQTKEALRLGELS